MKNVAVNLTDLISTRHFLDNMEKFTSKELGAVSWKNLSMASDCITIAIELLKASGLKADDSCIELVEEYDKVDYQNKIMLLINRIASTEILISTQFPNSFNHILYKLEEAKVWLQVEVSRLT